MSVLRTTGLTRRFGERAAVADLTLQLDAGGVIGLVGPNGSGKSTLIRMLLGLVRPTSGSAIVLGHSIEDPAAYTHRVGALIENPAFVPGLTARANLLTLARLRGLPSQRVAEVIEIVGLSGRDTEPVKRFSLGMKQRLGIAAALLPDPELLILDEPTNGLDPAGIVEIRSLLRLLGQSGRTVIVSSHLLSEIEAVCDRLVIIRFGVLIYVGPTSGLVARASAYLDVRPERDEDAEELAALLRRAGWDVRAVVDGLRVEGAAEADAAGINRTAAGAGVTLRALVPGRPTLEDLFLQMTGHDDGELALARAGAAEQSVESIAVAAALASGSTGGST